MLMQTIQDYVDEFKRIFNQQQGISEELRALGEELAAVLLSPGPVNGSYFRDHLRAFDIETDEDRIAISSLVKFLHDHREGYVDACARESIRYRYLKSTILEVINNNIGIGTEKLKAYRELVLAECLSDEDDDESVDELLDSFPVSSKRLISLLTERKRLELKQQHLCLMRQTLLQRLHKEEQLQFYEGLGLGIFLESAIGHWGLFLMALGTLSFSKSQAEQIVVQSQIQTSEAEALQKRVRVLQKACFYVRGKQQEIMRQIEQQALIDKCIRLLDEYLEDKNEATINNKSNSKFFHDRQDHWIERLKEKVLLFGETGDAATQQELSKEVSQIKRRFGKSFLGKQNERLVTTLIEIEQSLLLSPEQKTDHARQRSLSLPLLAARFYRRNKDKKNASKNSKSTQQSVKSGHFQVF